VRLVILDKLVFKDILDLKVLLEMLLKQVPLDILVFKGRLVVLDRRDLRVLLDGLDTLVPVEILDHKAKPVLKGKPDRKEIPDIPVGLDHKDSLEVR
jgi:hypothetical protein